MLSGGRLLLATASSRQARVASKQGFGNLLEHFPRNGGAQGIIAPVFFADVTQKDARGRVGRQSPLDLFGLVTQNAVQVGGGRNAGFDLLPQPFADAIIEVNAAQFRVAMRGMDAQRLFGFGKDGNVQRTAAEVEHEQVFLGFRAFDGVGKRGSRRLIDQSERVQADDFRRRQQCFPRRAAEIGRNGQNHILNRFADFSLRVGDDMLQNQRGHFFGLVRLPEQHKRLVRIAQ